MEEMEPRQEAALELLGMGVSKKKTAETLKVSTRTLRRWCAEPQFKAALADSTEVSRLIVHAQIATQIRATVGQNRHALRCLADGIQGRPVNFTQIRCAQAVMNQFSKWASAFIKQDNKTSERKHRQPAADVAQADIANVEIPEEAPVSELSQTSQPSQTSHPAAVEKRPKADTPMPIAKAQAKSEERLTLAQRMAERVRQQNLQKIAERAARSGQATTAP